MLLALDTSTSAVTVAVLDDGSRSLLAERSVVDARRTTELLGPLVAEVLAAAEARPADVTLVAVGTGPGPFTGLRVGMVTGTTFAHARGVPCLGVCSLDALAHTWFVGDGFGTAGRVAVATDARRREVYLGVYEGRGRRTDLLPWSRVLGPRVVRPVDVPEEVRHLPTLGRGPALYPELLGEAVGDLDVSASAIGALALARRAAGVDQPVEPLYLRRPDAVAPGGPKPALDPRRRAEAPGRPSPVAQQQTRPGPPGPTAAAAER